MYVFVQGQEVVQFKVPGRCSHRLVTSPTGDYTAVTADFNSSSF